MYYRKNLFTKPQPPKKLPLVNVLTLGELMRMDGEDIWVEYFECLKTEKTVCRFFKGRNGADYLCLGCGRFLPLSEYSITWRAHLEDPGLPSLENDFVQSIIPAEQLSSMEQKGLWLDYIDNEDVLNGRWTHGHFIQGRKDSYYRTDFGKLLFLSDYGITWQASYTQPNTPDGAIPEGELEYMNGARVWVKHEFYSNSIEGWATVILDRNDESYCLLDSGEKLYLSRQCLDTDGAESHASYEETWWAYYQCPKPNVFTDNQTCIPSIHIPHLDPIPVDMLREMDGKSVWAVWKEKTGLKVATSKSVVVISPIGNCCQADSGKSLSFANYASDWLAYDEKSFEEWLAGNHPSAGRG